MKLDRSLLLRLLLASENCPDRHGFPSLGGFSFAELLRFIPTLNGHHDRSIPTNGRCSDLNHRFRLSPQSRAMRDIEKWRANKRRMERQRRKRQTT